MNWSIEWTDKLGRHHYKSFSNYLSAQSYVQFLDNDCTEIVLKYIGDEEDECIKKDVCFLTSSSFHAVKSLLNRLSGGEIHVLEPILFHALFQENLALVTRL